MTREVGSYSEDNAETARFEGDDVGLPESPIFSNFTKHLWRAHTPGGTGALVKRAAVRGATAYAMCEVKKQEEGDT